MFSIYSLKVVLIKVFTQIKEILTWNLGKLPPGGSKYADFAVR